MFCCYLLSSKHPLLIHRAAEQRIVPLIRHIQVTNTARPISRLLVGVSESMASVDASEAFIQVVIDNESDADCTVITIEGQVCSSKGCSISSL